MVDPVAFSFFGLEIYWYGISYVVGFLFTYWFILHYAQTLKLPKDKLEEMFLPFMIFSVLGGRIFHIFFYDLSYFAANPLEIFRFDKGGMSIHGGLTFGVATLYYYARKYKLNVLKIIDLFVIPTSLALAFGRLANFVNQELVGKVTTSNLGIVFPRVDDSLRWPTQIFESAKNFVLFQFLYSKFIFSTYKPGILTAWFFILYNIPRFIIDFLREPELSLGLISMGQLLSLIYGIFGIVLYIKLRKN